MKRRTISGILAGITMASVLGLVLANPDPLVRHEQCKFWCPRSDNPQFWNEIVEPEMTNALLRSAGISGVQ